MPALMSKRPSAVLGEIHRELHRRRKLATVAKGRIMKKSSAPPAILSTATGYVSQKPPTPISRKPTGAAIKKSSLPRPRAPAIAYLQLGEAPQIGALPPKGRPTLTPFGFKGFSVANKGIQKSAAPMPHERDEAATKNTLPPMPRKPAEAAATKKSAAPTSRATPPPHPSSADFKPIQKGATVCVRTPMGTLPTGLRLFIWLSAVVVSDEEGGYLDVMYKGDFPRDNPFPDVRVARDQVKIMPSPHQ